MEKITANHPLSQSTDIIKQNLDALKALFPTIVKEGKIDMEELKALLGEEVEVGEEYYRFTWAGKSQARQEANKPSTGTLRPVKEESKDWDTTQNIFIEGDNLEVLKLLQKSYSNKIKLIYIDPPYNTGKDFVYKDNYKDNLNNYFTITSQTDNSGRKLSTNTESDGRFHSNWLNMMYPRLKLSQNLLKDDGVILISIDDNEISNLRKLCDEILGESNFLACLIWEKGRKNDSKFFSIGHEYILIYAKNKQWLHDNKIFWREEKPGAKEIHNEYLRLKAIFLTDFQKIEDGLKLFYSNLPKDHPSKKHSRYSNVDARGVWRDDNMSLPRGGARYEVIHPVTNLPCAIPPGGWRYATLEKMEQKIKEGYVVFRKDHSEPPIRKTYLLRSSEEEIQNMEESDPTEEEDDSDDNDIGIQVAGTYFYRSGLQATNELKDIFKTQKIFNNPKDHQVISRLIDYCTNRDKNAIILDFFAGSGTTAHSTMDLNIKDEGQRRFICVQLQETIPQNKEAYKAGYKAIPDITKERIRRAGEKLKSEYNDLLKSTHEIPDTGFRVFKLDNSNIRAWDGNVEKFEQNLLSAAENIKHDRSETDVLFEILLKSGLDLAQTLEEKVISGKKVFNIGSGALFICLSNDLTTEVAEGIGKWKQESAPSTCRVIFKDTGFTDVEKTNSIQILKQYGITEVNTI